MRRLITLFFLVFTLSGVAFAQQMSDDQVVQYVKSAQQMGKNQKQITTELMRRGVTKEQVERIQKKYENSKSGSPQSNTQDEKRSRQRGELWCPELIPSHHLLPYFMLYIVQVV